MKVFVSEIPEQGLSVDFRGNDFVWIGLKGLDVAAYPGGRLFIQKSGPTVFLQGEVGAELVLPCSRCLESFSFPINLQVRYTLQPKTSISDREVILTPEDLEYGYYDEDTLDLERLIEEPVLLSIPMKPLCQEGCLGICPICGEVRNLHPCECMRDVHNSPFTVLKEFFKASP